MTLAAVLTAVQAADIRLTVEGDRLVVETLDGALTPELRAALVAHKPTLLGLLAPPRAFVTLMDGPTMPIEVIELALRLEQRGFRLALDAEQQIVVERTEDTPESTELSDLDQLLVDRWRLHLGAIAQYDAPPPS